MRITPVNPINSLGSIGGIGSVKSSSEAGAANGGVSFKDTIKNAVGEVNNLQHNADQLAVKMASGDLEDVHKAMIAMNKAKLALDFTIQVRNKVIEAYQEIMRMQV